MVGSDANWYRHLYVEPHFGDSWRPKLFSSHKPPLWRVFVHFMVYLVWMRRNTFGPLVVDPRSFTPSYFPANTPFLSFWSDSGYGSFWSAESKYQVCVCKSSESLVRSCAGSAAQSGDNKSSICSLSLSRTLFLSLSLSLSPRFPLSFSFSPHLGVVPLRGNTKTPLRRVEIRRGEEGKFREVLTHTVAHRYTQTPARNPVKASWI